MPARQAASVKPFLASVDPKKKARKTLKSMYPGVTPPRNPYQIVVSSMRHAHAQCMPDVPFDSSVAVQAWADGAGRGPEWTAAAEEDRKRFIRDVEALGLTPPKPKSKKKTGYARAAFMYSGDRHAEYCRKHNVKYLDALKHFGKEWSALPKDDPERLRYLELEREAREEVAARLAEEAAEAAAEA